MTVVFAKFFRKVGFNFPPHSGMTAEANAAELLKIWRDKKFPFFHIKHCSFNPNSPLNEGNEGNGFKDIVAPIDGEPTIRKNVSSDATATFNNKGLDGQNYSAELMHGTSLASLNEEFATIVTTDDLKQNILTSDD